MTCTRLGASVRFARSRLRRAAGDLERARRAIAGFPDPGRLPAIAATIKRDLTTARANAGDRDIVEEPSPAELAVLRASRPGLSRREIGERLYISLSTVRTHTRDLFRKLGVTSRADAVARAEALGPGMAGLGRVLDQEYRSRPRDAVMSLGRYFAPGAPSVAA